MKYPRRIKKLDIDIEFFLNTLMTNFNDPLYDVTWGGIPADVKVVGFYPNEANPTCITIYLEHASFPEVDIHEDIPHTNLTVTKLLRPRKSMPLTIDEYNAQESTPPVGPDADRL